jgi:DNA-directed RNA polymerase specialized sigma24 family protein
VSNALQLSSSVSIVQFLPCAAERLAEQRKAIYEKNRRRVYSFAFWMTDSEPTAEHVSECTFVRAFSLHEEPTPEQIDRALLRELQKEASVHLEPVQLRCGTAVAVNNVRGNTRRVELERAIVQLPYTERMIFCMHDGDGYDHARIARTLGILEEDSRRGLHQARLRIRELVSAAASQPVC